MKQRVEILTHTNETKLTEHVNLAIDRIERAGGFVLDVQIATSPYSVSGDDPALLGIWTTVLIVSELGGQAGQVTS